MLFALPLWGWIALAVIIGVIAFNVFSPVDQPPVDPDDKIQGQIDQFEGQWWR